MTTFKCRTVVPKVSEWRDVETSSPEVAANDFHEKWLSELQSFVVDVPPERLHMARVEVEGHGQWISRVFWSGIARRGRVRPRIVPTLVDIATALGFEGDPSGLLEPGWDGEETTSDAEKRRSKRWIK